MYCFIGFDAFGDVLQPLKNNMAPQGPGATKAEQPKLVASDLDTSLASLASNLTVKTSATQIKKLVLWCKTAQWHVHLSHSLIAWSYLQ